MNRRLLIGLFLGLSFVQIMVPLSMILRRESTLRTGESFRFKTEPVDPYDAFRGRYVALRIKEDSVEDYKGTRLTSGQSVYAQIAVDEAGYAKFTAITVDKPRGAAFIQAKVRYISSGIVRLGLPFDRYYMEETAAPRAESAYREHTRQAKPDAYVLVRVKDGFAVLEALYLGDRRIEDAVDNEK